MSTLSVNSITSISADTSVSLTGGSLVATDIKTTSINSGPIGGTRNRLINSAMEIDQRNAGSSVTLNNAGAFTVDRWQAAAIGGSGTGTATAQRVADAPSGFTYSLKYTVTNAKTPSSGDQFYIYQPLEGQNITDFAYGTASTKTVALSFQVKSSLTGTFSARLRSYNGSTSRSYVFNYTINSANTWQYVTITAPGDAGQVPSTDNTLGYDVLFDLGSGSTYQTSTLNAWQTGNYYRSTISTNLIATNGATFYLTGVQLEIGTTATPFERRIYGQELALCQRYYFERVISTVGSYAPAVGYTLYQSIGTPVTMRATPTSYPISGASNTNCTITTTSASTTDIRIDVTSTTGGQNYSIGGIIKASAEL